MMPVPSGVKAPGACVVCGDKTEAHAPREQEMDPTPNICFISIRNAALRKAAG